jgi:hypothetical protein
MRVIREAVKRLFENFFGPHFTPVRTHEQTPHSNAASATPP